MTPRPKTLLASAIVERNAALAEAEQQRQRAETAERTVAILRHENECLRRQLQGRSAGQAWVQDW